MSVDDSSPAVAFLEPRDRDGDRDHATAVAVLVLVGIFGFVAGPVGLVVGLGTAGVWYAFGVPYAIAVGHVGLVAVFPDGISALEFVLVELAVVTVLLVSVRHASAPGRVAVVALATGLLLGGTAWLVFLSRSLWLAVAVFVALFVLVGYGVHRYELVRLGLVSERPRTAHTAYPDGTESNE